VDIDAATLAAVRAHAKGLARLSAERITQELAKLLAVRDPGPTVALMAKTGVLAEILPDARFGPQLARLLEHEAEIGANVDWLRRLAVLLPPDTADAVARRLKLSNADADRLAILNAGEPNLNANSPQTDLNRALYRLGPSAVTGRLLIAWSRNDDDARWKDQLARAAAWEDKTLPVNGADVLALGLTPGPQVGELLRAVENWWIEAGFVPGRDEALGRLKMLAKT
jgi:poly(A) polymerase